MDKPEETQDKPSEQPKETSETKPETFTEKQVVERERKLKSDSAAEIGRLTKSHADLLKSSQALQDRLDQKARDAEELELEKHRDEPAEIRRIRAEGKTRTVESELATTKQKLEEANAKTAEAQEAADKHTKERNAREVATRLGVDAKLLAELAIPTDGSVEAIEEKSKLLPKTGDAKNIRPDSGKTSGGGNWRDLSPSEKVLKGLNKS